MRGYAGKCVEVDLNSQVVKDVTFSEQILRKFIGGRGLATKILWDRIGERWSEIDPLSSENVLLALTGPMTGFFPGGRIMVSGKSPQSNGIVGSTVAGEFPVELKCAGYDGIVITGKAAKPVYILITDSGVEIRDASHIWGKRCKDTLKILTKETRAEIESRHSKLGILKEAAVLYIGPAGEALCRVAAVNSKWTHSAGYGGYGAVMGSKNLKALVAKGLGPLPDVADHDKVVSMIEKVCHKCYDVDGMKRWGTGSGGFAIGNELSSEPIKNWQEEWHTNRSFGVDQFEKTVWIKRHWGDFGCPTTCLKISMPRTGPYKGAITDNPDYELQAYLGTNLGVFTPEANVYLTALIDDLGFCGIQAGNVLGFAAELYQRGILTKEDLNGIDLKWGNVEAFGAMISLLVERRGIGDILAEGTYRAALRLGKMKNKDLLPYAIQSKGIGIGAHGIRSTLDFPMEVSYACSVQGGDHTSTAQIPIRGMQSELAIMLHDSGVYCQFNAFPLQFDVLLDFLNAVTGFGVTQTEWYDEIALRIIQIQRAALILGGPDATWNPRFHDDNPQRFYEPLPTGPKKGLKADRSEVQKQVKEYYGLVGWDEHGIPKSESLAKLGLEDVDRVLKSRLH